MAITANRELNRYVDQELRSFGVAAGEHIYKGALVGVERASGYVRNLVAGDSFAGVAYESVDNSGGNDADRAVRVYTQGDFILAIANGAQALAGQAVYAVDNESLTANPEAGASQAGILMAVVGMNTGIVRITPFAMPSVEQQIQCSLSGSTSAAVTHVVMITQRPIRVVSADVVYLTAPDQGALDVGYTLADPDDVVNGFDLTSLSANTVAALSLSGRDVPAGVSLLAKVGQASSSAGTGGLLTLRYLELP